MTAIIAPAPSATGSVPSSPAGSQPAALGASRDAVRRLLTAIPTFTGLSESERQELAMSTVKVLAFMADPNGVYSDIAAREARGELPPGSLPREVAAEPAAQALSAPAAEALDAVEDTKKSLSKSPGFAGKQFEAGAVKQGVEQFGELVRRSIFPNSSAA